MKSQELLIQQFFFLHFLGKLEEHAPESKEAEKQRRKLDKELRQRAKDAERRRQKDEKKRQKDEAKERKKAGKGAAGASSLAQSSSGATLEEFRASADNPIPVFLDKAIAFIEREGLDAEGLYRVPGNRAHVDLLFQKFDDGKE